MPRVALALLVALSGFLAYPGGAVAEAPPFDCSEEDLSESTGEDANGWANVFYDYHNLVDPARPNALNEAAQIALAVRAEAVEALMTYQALGELLEKRSWDCCRPPADPKSRSLPSS